MRRSKRTAQEQKVNPREADQGVDPDGGFGKMSADASMDIA
jgi:hypothetical protein